QCSEVKIHACIYKTHPQVQSVVHIHPRYTILMSVLTGSLRPMRQEGAELLRHKLPIYPHVKTIQSDAEGMELANLLGDSRAILLRGHGAVTTGKSLSEAGMGMVPGGGEGRVEHPPHLAAGKDPSELRREFPHEEGLWPPPLRTDPLREGPQRPPSGARRHLELPEASGVGEAVRSASFRSIALPNVRFENLKRGAKNGEEENISHSMNSEPGLICRYP